MVVTAVPLFLGRRETLMGLPVRSVPAKKKQHTVNQLTSTVKAAERHHCLRVVLSCPGAQEGRGGQCRPVMRAERRMLKACEQRRWAGEAGGLTGLQVAVGPL